MERSDRKNWEPSRNEKTMYTGTTIEELINSVERAERHAREEERQHQLAPLPWMHESKHQELVEVA